jgi:hypothetical protein
MEVEPMISDGDKRELIKMADRLFCISRGQESALILCAKYDAGWKALKPRLVRWDVFDKDEELEIVSRYYKPKTFDADPEPEDEIVTGSVDPKSGRRRRIIDPTAEPVKAASIPSQIKWSEVKPFQMPDLDSVIGWSKDKDDALNKDLLKDKLFKPETSALAPKLDVSESVVTYLKDTVPSSVIQKTALRLKEKYPESKMDLYFNRAISRQKIFDDLQATPVLHEVMRPCPKSAKMAALRNLIESGQFDEMPFQFRATAILLSRGFSDPDIASDVFLDCVLGFTKRRATRQETTSLSDQDFNKLRHLYSPESFVRYRSVIEYMLSEIDKSSKFQNLWRRFTKTLQQLTKKQADALSHRYMGSNQRPTYRAEAQHFGISVDSLRDRIAQGFMKIRKAFPEFGDFKKEARKTKGPLLYDGLFRRESAELVRPLTRIKAAGGLELRELLRPPTDKPKLVKASPEIERWLAKLREREAFIEKIDAPEDRRFEDWVDDHGHDDEYEASTEDETAEELVEMVT